MSKDEIEPLGAGARALIGEQEAAEHDAIEFRARMESVIARLQRFVDWMQTRGVPPKQLTPEWYAAVAPMLPELQSRPKRRSNRERNWTWLLADALYLERMGVRRGPSLIGRLKTDRGWLPDKSSLVTRLSEARNKSLIGQLLKTIESSVGSDVRREVEDILIKSRCASLGLQFVAGKPL